MQPVVNRNRVEQREKQGTEKYCVAHKHTTTATTKNEIQKSKMRDRQRGKA
jgi:hypothetical protein